MNIVVNHKVLTLCIVETGSCQTLLDLGMTRYLHLPVRVATLGEFGCYLVPGSTELKAYHGVMESLFTVTLADGVHMELKGIRVVEHQAPLLLLGADVMRGGCISGWNFAGIRTVTSAPGEVKGTLEFAKAGNPEVCCSSVLVYSPAASTERFQSSMLAMLTGGTQAMVSSGGSGWIPHRV